MILSRERCLSLVDIVKEYDHVGMSAEHVGCFKVCQQQRKYCQCRRRSQWLMTVPSHRIHAVYTAWGTRLTGLDLLPSSNRTTQENSTGFLQGSSTEKRPAVTRACSTRKAYNTRLHDSSRLDTSWSDALCLSLTITPSTLRLDTRSMLRHAGGGWADFPRTSRALKIFFMTLTALTL